jgi:hypothetical protein
MSIIEVQNGHHLGDNIINFIFFYKIKNYIEENNITIHYYCLNKYHKNLLDFKCSNNIKILDYENKGHVLWQGGSTPQQHYIEDQLCGMFNIFLQKHNIPISVNLFEYKDDDLLKRHQMLDNKYKNIEILVINSTPLSDQYKYDKTVWDNFIVKLSSKYVIATTEKVNDSIISLHDSSVKNIAAIALNVKKIIAINTGPSIPLYNTDILDNVEIIYLLSGLQQFKTRKVKLMRNIEDLNFLL